MNTRSDVFSHHSTWHMCPITVLLYIYILHVFFPGLLQEDEMGVVITRRAIKGEVKIENIPEEVEIVEVSNGAEKVGESISEVGNEAIE